MSQDLMPQRDFTASGKDWRRAACLIVLLLGLQAAGATVHSMLKLDAGAVWDKGEWWRLITAHFVHLSWPHALLNAAGVAVCCALAPAVFDRRLGWRLAWLAAGTSMCLAVFSPGLLPYVGLSGVLYGLFAQGLLPAALQRDRQAMLALACLAAWLAWQSLAGPLEAEEALIGGRIAHAAHLYGVALAIVGCIGAALWRRRLPRV